MIRVASFNLNNLFSRFNFEAEVDALPPAGMPGHPAPALQIITEIDPSKPGNAKFRTFKGRLIKPKPAADRATLAARIAAIDADILAVQEVEDVTTLTAFARDELTALGYKHIVLVEGNDERLIDVGLLSRRPVGAVTSWRHARHSPTDPDPIFSRDLLQVQILKANGTQRLLTVFVTHLKSKFCDFREDPVLCQEHNTELRSRQSETAARIIAAQTRPDSHYLICGDFNDSPGSSALQPLVADTDLRLVDGLADAVPDRPAPKDTPPAPDRPWSDRFKEPHKDADYQLIDQIWLSPATAGRLSAAGIGRRTHLSGDATDHDPVWVDLDL
jgi:endonuclease/exonuclease/phosphatase family metal-dependent hydrolase